jgi:hypothetical protein
LSFATSKVYASHPEAKFDVYGIQKCKTLSEYQKYVGQTVVYLPTKTPSYYDKNDFKGEFNKEYIISRITGDDKRMTFLLQEKNGKSKVKMVINNQDELYSYGKYTFCITMSYTVPLFLIDKFNQDKPKFIGKKFTNERAKAEYECTDVVMQVSKSKYLYELYPTVHYVLKNSLTSELIIVSAETAQNDCFKKDLSGKYVSTLVKVEKPADETIRYGKTKTIEAEGITKYSYVDDYIDILIFGGNEQFSFLLKNISQNTLKLVWNEAVFVDFNGSTSKVMHSGTKYAQKNEDQPASTIIKGASIDDIAVPTCNIRYSDILKEWVTDTMYPNEPAKSPGELKLMLPIQVKDVVNEYIFIFKIDWVFDHPELIKQ